jgi:uncharacterized protein (DUF1684 family)
VNQYTTGVFQKYKLAAFVVALILTSMLALPVLADENIVVEVQSENHQQAVEAWRASRHDSFIKTDGWLTLVGLEWLEEGESRIGSAADNDIQLSGGPAYWGLVTLQGDRVSFRNLDKAHVSINNQALMSADMIPDTEGEPTVVSSENLSFYSIFRQSYGLRIKDTQAKALQNFVAVENYPIDESWLINGHFSLAQEGAGIEIANVLGQISESPVFGTFEFEKDGKPFSLVGFGSKESENLWFIFSDRTSGHGTYGAGRFLYSDGMPENGRLTVDFNKAYNPPCAFNPWSTCPLPPQRNRMDLLVLAGEKDFHPDTE